LAIGYDSGDAVSGAYKPRFPFSGGRWRGIEIERTGTWPGEGVFSQEFKDGCPMPETVRKACDDPD
jgi:hypothetical protein